MLDAHADHERITHLSNEVRFGDAPLAAAVYTVAFLRQMAVPSIAAVVFRGGHGPIIKDTRTRNDDTLAFFGEFMRCGHSSPRGRAAIERLNEIHAPFSITNEQSLYTLGALTFEVERTSALLGVQLLSSAEQEANFHFWRGVGEQMGLHDLHESPQSFWRWTKEHERLTWGHTEGGRAVAEVMIEDLLARWLPAWLRPLGRQAVLALCEDALLDVHRLPHPAPGVRAAVRAGTRAYRLARRLLPDPPDRSWADHFGAAYGACPEVANMGYHPRSGGGRR